MVEASALFRRIPIGGFISVSPHTVRTTSGTNLEANISGKAQGDCGFEEASHLLELGEGELFISPVKYAQLVTNA